MTLPLFDAEPLPPQVIADGAVLLRGWAAVHAHAWIAAVQQVLAQQPFQAAFTASGLPMSVRTSNCGEWGWAASRSGYGYTRSDPATGMPWPAMPTFLKRQAQAPAAQAGYPGFDPDVCLINSYDVGAKMGLHHDADEKTTPRPSCPCRWGCHAPLSGVACSVQTPCAASGWSMAMCWSGAALRAWCFMVYGRCRPGSITCWVRSAGI